MQSILAEYGGPNRAGRVGWYNPRMGRPWAAHETARRLAVLLVALAAGCGEGASSEPRLPVAFPAGFRFGFATVAYQSEGTLRADGTRVDSNWSEWEDLGKVKDGQHNDRGNGFFDHYAEDLDRAASLGADAFSYALDWSRLEPAPGEFDDQELARVVAIVQAMRDRGLAPLIVLFHWVTPAWVQSPTSGVDLLAGSDQAFVDAFLPLVEHVVPALAGLVDDWVTFEEPYSIIGGEYLSGEHPPGKLLDLTAASHALVNLMYLHARTYRRVHDLDTVDADGDGVAARVGFENIAMESVPLDPKNPADVAAAEHFDYIVNHQFLAAIWNGDIDLDFDGKAESQDTDPPERHDPELAGTLDFIGLNYYSRARVEAGGLFGNVKPIYATPHIDVREYDVTVPHSDMFQEIAASGLRTVIEEYSRYGLPLVVTENGLADADDDQRPYFLLEHLYTVGRAVADGYDVRGYYCWTISDNFEWSDGVDSRFGLFSVDFTQPDFPRTRTRSADVFAAIAGGRRIDRALWDTWALPAYPVGIPAE